MTASWNLASLRICASKRCRHIDAMDVRSLTSYAAGIAAGRVRRSDFNQDLSAAGACSSRSRELACSNSVTEYRERIRLEPPVLIPTFNGIRLFSLQAGIFRCCRLT